MARASLDDATTWDQYGYVGGDPVDISDPAGLDLDNQATWNASPSAPYFCWDSAMKRSRQITQAVETWSGQGISYQYISLKRLVSAISTPTGSGGPAAWTETMQYDGFGNLTSKVLNGTTTSIPVNAATNRLAYDSGYDANGNMISGAGVTLAYEEANRVVSATLTGGGTEYYAYAADGKRIFRAPADGSAQEWTFWGARGEKLGTFNMVYSPYGTAFVPVLSPVVWFAGRQIWDGGRAMLQDRLGTNRWTGARYYPYGDEITSTANDATKFATYRRDGFTGLDYADQRMYASSYGRFNSVDQSGTGAEALDPGTWNRYTYTNGDPINLNDPEGRCPPGYVPATTAAQLQSIVNTAESYVGQDLTHTTSDKVHFQWGANGSLEAIDCTGLIGQALAGIAYSATGLQTPSAQDQFNTGSIPSNFSSTTTWQVGDIISFGNHAGIVTGVVNGQVTSFVGSQSSSGPANVTLANSSYWAKRMSTAKAFVPCVPAPTKAGLGPINQQGMPGGGSGGLVPVVDAFLTWVQSIPLGGGGPTETVTETIRYDVN